MSDAVSEMLKVVKEQKFPFVARAEYFKYNDYRDILKDMPEGAEYFKKNRYYRVVDGQLYYAKNVFSTFLNRFEYVWTLCEGVSLDFVGKEDLLPSNIETKRVYIGIHNQGNRSTPPKMDRFDVLAYLQDLGEDLDEWYVSGVEIKSFDKA